MHAQAVGRLENMVGWYHSHPGYGCWLSGIDVSTQSIQQQYQEPFLAIVVDPHRDHCGWQSRDWRLQNVPRGQHPCLREKLGSVSRAWLSCVIASQANLCGVSLLRACNPP